MMEEIEPVKAIMMRFQVEMRNMLLETGRTPSLLWTCKGLGWIVLCSKVLWKVVLVSDEIGYLAEDISKQSVEGAA